MSKPFNTTTKNKTFIIDLLWIFISISLILIAIYISGAIAFIGALIFFGISYGISGISQYGRGGNPYREMMISPQPNEIEYSTYKMDYNNTLKNTVKNNNKPNWFVLVIGVATFIILFYIILTH